MRSTSAFTRWIWAGFAALMAAGLLVALSAAHAITHLRETSELLVEEYTASLVQVEQLRSVLQRRADAGEVYLLTGEERFLAERSALRATVAAQERLLTETLQSEPEAELLARVLRADAELNRSFERARALRDTSGGEAAVRRWEAEVAPVRARLQRTLDALAEHQESRFERAAERADDEAAALLRSNVIIASIALLTATLLAVAVTRVLVRMRRVEEEAAGALRREERTQRLLAETGAALTSSLEMSSTIRSLARLAVREFADVCAADLVASRGFQRVAVEHRSPADAELARALCEAPPREDARCPALHAMQTARAELIADVTDRVLEERFTPVEHRRVVQALGVRSLISVPVVARGQVLGALTFFRTDPARPYVEIDVALAEELGRRVAVALDNARLYEGTRRAVEARDRVLAIVSHDLKNPLGVVMMCAQQLLRSRDPTRVQRCGERIQSAGERMQHLIRDLLDLASIDAGRLSMRWELQPPDALAREAVELIRPLAHEKAQHLAVELEPGLPFMPCDRERVLQVLSNLLGNAVKFAPVGGHVELRVERAGDEVRFSVSDDGPGIPDDQLPHVFERFWRATPEHRDGGTGLGLSIARGLVEAHGGRIWVEQRARGTTFAFTLTAGAPREVTPTPEAGAHP